MDERSSYQRWMERSQNLPGSLLRRWNAFRNKRTADRWTPPAGTHYPGFRAVLELSRVPSDISEHLPALFLEALEAEARLMVELGTRSGDSTFALTEAAKLLDATLVSVDIEDCSVVSEYPRWHFVQCDDLAFAEEFDHWCRNRTISPEIDLLFVDTTHAYLQTVKELEAWMPLLSPRGRAIFHDTNMGGRYRRSDGTTGRANNNERGVIRALEEFLGAPMDETRSFRTFLRGFSVTHFPLCNGLTVLRSLPNVGSTSATIS